MYKRTYIVSSYYHKHQLPVIVARIFNIIGPRQSGHYGMVVPKFIEQAKQNKTLSIYGDGQQTRIFCHVKSFCHILSSLLEADKAIGEVINVGNDKPVTIKTIAQMVIRQLSSSARYEYVDFATAYGSGYIAIHDRRPELSKLHSIIGSLPTMRFDDALDDIVHCQT